MKRPFSTTLFLVSLGSAGLGLGSAEAKPGFAGTFYNAESGSVIELHRAQGSYRGTLSLGTLKAELQASVDEDHLMGLMRLGQGEPLGFIGWFDKDVLVIESVSGAIRYVRTSNRPGSGAGSPGPAKAQQNRPQPEAPEAAGGPTGQAAARIGGSALFILSTGSIMRPHSSYSSSEIDFCSNGTFRDRSEYGYSVGGDYDVERGQNDDWAGGAGRTRSSGRWAIEQGQQGPVVRLYWNNEEGSRTDYPLQQFMEGRWRVGRTKYAVDWKNGECP
ncbi:MAG: hypothetical protein ACFB9M_20605 [Myxococcota bacterium]